MSHHMLACVAHQGELAACACGMSELSSPLAEHLARCPSCRSDFTAYMTAHHVPPMSPKLRTSITHQSWVRRNAIPLIYGLLIGGLLVGGLLMATMQCGSFF